MSPVPDLLRGLGQAARSALRSPWHSAVVVTLALGVGAATAVGAVAREAILRPLPFREPQGEPESLAGYRFSADVFPMLGREPLLGRVFVHREDRPRADRVVVLSPRLWIVKDWRARARGSRAPEP